MRALERLRRRADFLRAATSRRKWVTPSLILQAMPRGTQPASDAIRVGFTASRKVGNAVIRNRARRRLRAAAAALLPGHATAAFDYVLIARAETPKRDYRLLLGDLEAALRRIDAWIADGH